MKEIPSTAKISGTITVKNISEVAFTQGGKGSDTLYVGEGTDTIFDYERGDVLKILKADGSEGGTIYLKNLTTATNININGTMHTISGKTLK